jgi:hypothetical protein
MAFRDDDERRAYFREYNKGWYLRHREKRIAVTKKRHQEIQNWFRRYKSALCCLHCGENHPACLQFHHRDRLDKSFTLASVVGRASSIKQIMREIEKCDVLCANCHAKLHWQERQISEGGGEDYAL